MNIDLVLYRQISVLSIFFGIILGIVTLIPFAGTFSFIFLICFVAPLVICILIKYGCIPSLSTKESIVTGAVAGFVSYLGFSLIYIPVSVILMKLFNLTANYGIGLMLSQANFFILCVLSIFMGILSATVNAFTGFLTFYVIELLNSINK